MGGREAKQQENGMKRGPRNIIDVPCHQDSRMTATRGTTTPHSSAPINCHEQLLMGWKWGATGRGRETEWLPGGHHNLMTRTQMV
jgi:hypothetical protein